MAKHAIRIDTSKYMGERRVFIDDKDWLIKVPGIGTEFKVNQAQRRIKLLDKKIADGTATEADYDQYDQLEKNSIAMFYDMFSDGTEDNASVKQWVNATSMSVLLMVFEDIQKQSANGGVELDGKADDTNA